VPTRRKQKWKSAARRSKSLDATLARLGRRLRALRLSHELSQEELAAQAQLDAKHYQELEHGRTNATVATLLALSRAFRVTLAELLEGV
jgi:transcriptional regulator with XRE-family HTH domain